MRFLLDNNLSPKLAELLHAAGHDVVHVRDSGLGSATDSMVIEAARAQGTVSRLPCVSRRGGDGRLGLGESGK